MCVKAVSARRGGLALLVDRSNIIQKNKHNVYIDIDLTKKINLYALNIVKMTGNRLKFTINVYNY